MLYLLEIHQGGGCDYTIECGTRVLGFYADNFAEAMIKAKEMLMGDFVDEETSAYFF